MKNTTALLIALSFVGAQALAEEQKAAAAAQTNTSTVKTSEVQKADETRKDQSEEITNARMRAEAGSKSKFSVKANLAYQGGSVEKPFDKIRPNYRASSATQSITFLSGTVGMAYRASDKLTARIGTGLTMLTPLHNKASEIGHNQYEDAPDQRIINVSTPYLELSTSFRSGNIMHMPSMTYSHATDQFDVETVKQVGNISADHTMVAEIEGSGFQPGLETTVDYSFYKDGKQTYDVIGDGDARTDYNIGLYPFLEYAFNDRYSFRTVFGYFNYSHFRSEEAATFKRTVSYQSMGVGIALTPEIYFYPNVQFIPDDVRAERTNVGVSTTMSVF